MFAQIPTQAPAQKVNLNVDSSGGKNKITAKSLCDMIGTRYYMHNDEIQYQPEKIVRVFDENDQLIGDLTYREAQESALNAKKDLVLRNPKSEPPVVKIMLYRRELLKRLFQKLGRGNQATDTKTKSLRLQTTISMHDLENKKKQAINFLKSHGVLKLYMKVNQYDPENVQKGRLMLMNIAEDLKEYARVKVSPIDPNQATPQTQQKEKVTKGISKKGGKEDYKELERVADQNRANQDEVFNVDDLEDEDDMGNSKDFVKMELQSTVSFREIDIDKMLEQTTLDDFLKGLYISATTETTTGKKSHHEKLMSMFMGEKDQDDLIDAKQKTPELQFEDQMGGVEEFRSDNLRKQALQNLKERRQKQKQSQIFNQKEQNRQKDEVEEEVEDDSEVQVDITKAKRIDLTRSQLATDAEELDQNLDDFDLLEANIDPKDLRSQEKIMHLEQEIEEEKLMIKSKYLFKYSFQANDPMKITE